MSKTNPFPIFDGHNDTLLDIRPDRSGRSFFERSDKGHLDLPRARKGGFGGGFFAIFVPDKKRKKGTKIGPDKVVAPPPVKFDHAHRFTMEQIAALYRIETQSKGKVKVVLTADDIARCLKKGVLAVVLHFEGAEMIDPELNSLEVFYRAGLRSVGIVWSRPNAFGHGVPFQFNHSPDTGPGLTDAGKELVRACNRLGIMIDLSHLNEQGFWDVAKLSDAPLVATHSNVHALCPVTRNLTDKQLDAIKESDGLVGLNFATAFLREDGQNNADTPLETMVRHVDYLVERIGIDRVGMGSDYDGATVPQGVKDASHLPNLIDALRKGGYDDDSLRKLTHENWIRVLRKTWK